MNQFKSNNNYSLLNEEKKAKIMKDLRKEIDKQKEHYSMGSEYFNDMNNSNNIYEIQYENISNLKNNTYIQNQPKFTYECNDEINNNDFVNKDSNELKESDDNEEEHLQILNNAKNVLNQIQEDINKFSVVYGMKNIPQNNNQTSENNSHNYNNDINNDKSNNNNSSDNDNDDNNYDEINYNDNSNNNYNKNDDNDDYNNNSDEDNNINNYNDNNNYNEDDEEGDEEYNINGNLEQNMEEINNNKKNNNSVNMINEFKNGQMNIKENNKNYLEEELPRKKDYYNDYTNNFNFNTTNINNSNSIYTQNSSKSKYNFENPLNYDQENMKNNFKKYSNYSNIVNKRIESKSNDIIIEENNIKKKREAKSTCKPKIKNNNFKNLNQEVNSNKSKINNKKNINNDVDINYNVTTNENLYSIKNKEKFEIMKKELENKFAKEHPFRPKINKKYNGVNEETEEERINRLSRPKILDINEKKRKKDLELLKNISENNKKINTHKIDPKEVSNRLYNTHQQMKLKKDKIKQNYEENQNKEYSFIPEINVYSKMLMDKYQKKPIYIRNEEFEKQKTENIIRMRQEIEKEQKEKCKPLINEKSRKIALMNRNNNKNEDNYEEDVYERLYKENINKDIKCLGNREMKECTFTPKLNPISDYLISNNYSDNNYYDEDNMNYNNNLNNFLERQRMYEEIKKEKLEKNIINNKSKYTFKPEINSNSDLLVKCNPYRTGENNDDKYSRLYQDAQKIKMKKEKLENEINNKYDFTPKINELSKYIGRKPDTKEFNYIQDNKENSKNNKNEEEYDFKPQMLNNNKYKNIQSNYKNDQNILERINEEVQNKNKKIIMMKKIKENKDIEQCNFTPEINKEIPDFENNKPKYMKGMARYLNQMEKARQTKRDKERREKEVFLTGEGWTKNNGITIPKPFKLSYQNNQKTEIKKKEMEKEDKKECYFKPKTNESKNREIIKKLLIDN